MKKKQTLNNAESREFLKSYKKKKAKTWEELIFEREAKEKAKERKAKKGETFSVTYVGEHLSMNELKSNHWREVKPKYNRIKKKMIVLIEEKNPPKFQEIEMSIYYSGRLDLDNSFATEKAFADAFVECGYLADDKKKCIPKITIEWAKDLPHGTIIYEVKERI